MLGRRVDVLAWNALGDAANGFSRLAPAERNVPRLVFSDPASREPYPEWTAVAARTVARLGLPAGQYADGPGLSALVGEPSLKSEDFRRLWTDHEVRERAVGVKEGTAPAEKSVRGDRRTPVSGGRDDGGPREGRGPGQGRACASVASMEVREPLRRSLAPFAAGLGGEPLPPLPTPTNLPYAC
ncbi:MmyB family transcriptional regulator [Streptomyces flaveolus]|uniref:MmyB family transcriptional regulator n=1 Tax=Streptomyces flaveolus TaxID=67297 RepID=UPI003F53FABA